MSTLEPTGSHNIVRARHILVETEGMADTLLEQLKNGQHFAELAKAVSRCPSKERGGELGWFRRGTMVASFEDACFQGKPDQLIKIQTEYGWHVIQVQGQAIEPGSITVEDFAKIYPHQISHVQLVDVREQNELELARLDHFFHLPLGEYEKWAEQVESGELLDKEKETIVMCHHGIRSAQMCSYLAQQGFLKVRNLIGGIDAYAHQVDPSIGVY
ncbi:peptidyl-prolyl cis-trans isomerase C [Galdieria sulphuraria]|uniref:Peptidyl-prolyl cis-trans isomerase n=1 Tax=Galdieria sulphuraria TaxID=130081 RepID=M2Y4U7_GALSU|nr:peptidyl-prolyl cis-trans isomerase C [Galdieria sulphuraria]EME30993.1 peptidyl-prolyl cis-trans isomerase C [Galdieria sulphuraria]|eukprot:XP_005707513.1 peptidyl-prolyl cis-trans isomerase C [Galdieria sulphuraria]